MLWSTFASSLETAIRHGSAEAHVGAITFLNRTV